MRIFKAPNVEEMSARGDVAGLVKALAYKKDADVRARAARALQETGDTRCVPPLIEALDDEWNVRVRAIDALGHIGDQRAVEPLVSALSVGHVDREAQIAIIRALGLLGSPRAVAPLRQALFGPDSVVSSETVGALGRIGGPQAAEALSDAVRHYASPRHGLAQRKTADDRSAAAAITLVRLGQDGVNALIAILQNEESTRARCIAAERLARARVTAATKSLVAMLGAGDAKLRECAAASLAELDWLPEGDETGVAYRILIGDWEGCVTVGSPAIGPLVDALEHGSAQSRKGAAEALGQIGGPEAEAALAAALRDSSTGVRSSVAEALARVGWRPQSDGVAAEVLIASSQWDSCAALGAAALPALRTALEKGSEKTATGATRALGAVDGAEAAALLVAALGHRRAAVRRAAAEALGARSDPGIAEALLDVLFSETSPTVRAAATAAIGGHHRQEAVTLLEGRIGQAERRYDSLGGEPGGLDDLAVYMDDDSPGHAHYRQAMAEREALRKQGKKILLQRDEALILLHALKAHDEGSLPESEG